MPVDQGWSWDSQGQMKNDKEGTGPLGPVVTFEGTRITTQDRGLASVALERGPSWKAELKL